MTQRTGKWTRIREWKQAKAEQEGPLSLKMQAMQKIMRALIHPIASPYRVARIPQALWDSLETDEQAYIKSAANSFLVSLRVK
jgi:hypothetical protein